MKLEDQVCSLELAKKLKGFGVKQDSYFYWTKTVAGKRWKVFTVDYLKHFHKYEEERYSAFTVAELGEMLPDYCDFTQKHTNVNTKEVWYRCYYEGTNFWFDEKTEAEARAKMLIYLLETGFIKNE